MRTRLFFSLAALIALTGFAPAPFPKPEKKNANPAQSLQGTWSLVSQERATGKGLTPSQMKVRIDGDKWSFMRDVNGQLRTTITYILVVDAKKNPNWIDLKISTTAPARIQGIYSIEGDTLKMQYTTITGKASRPTSFAVLEGRQFRLTLKREKP